MIAGVSPVLQALLGTLFTWGLTAAGAALVFVFSSGQVRRSLLLFCPQVMLAASYWSLLAPAIEMAEDSGKYGDFAFVPVAVGFALGALFVYIADLMMPVLVSIVIYLLFLIIFVIFFLITWVWCDIAENDEPYIKNLIVPSAFS
uniref:Zinc transporter ZIP11 n=1 Tax=Cyprinus carpio TaxID=7962 RepID=A0A8C2F4S1_CYPCA